jgi:hypothetical protein
MKLIFPTTRHEPEFVNDLLGLQWKTPFSGISDPNVFYRYDLPSIILCHRPYLIMEISVKKKKIKAAILGKTTEGTKTRRLVISKDDLFDFPKEITTEIFGKRIKFVKASETERCIFYVEKGEEV